MKASEMRPGMAVTLDGNLYVCTQASHVTPGNLRAFVQAKLKRLSDGTIIDKRLRATEEIEQAYMDKRQMQYLYSDPSGHILMDTTTFDQITVPDDLIGDLIKFFKPETVLTTMVHNGNVVTLELPKTVDLTVTDTAPMPANATLTNQMKDADLETGLRVRVPPFIKIGDVVRISTEDGSYSSRVSK
ncbi:MAG: elongation factor P [Sedimentisphaerales bacterium]|nr:elongation factor P [Sedimentisphaerales bacterium]